MWKFLCRSAKLDRKKIWNWFFFILLESCFTIKIKFRNKNYIIFLFLLCGNSTHHERPPELDDLEQVLTLLLASARPHRDHILPFILSNLGTPVIERQHPEEVPPTLGDPADLFSDFSTAAKHCNHPKVSPWSPPPP